MDVIVVSIDRSGTTSLTKVINDLYALNETPGEARHESDDWALHDAIRHEMSGGESGAVRNLLAAWPHQVEVSTVLGFAMDTVRDVFGPEVKVIHLKRRRDPCIRSLVTMSSLFPESHFGYTEHPVNMPKRRCLTAVDFGERDEAAWKSLPIEEKWGWYYDKAHGLAEASLDRFTHTLSVATEDLSDPETLDRIRTFINPLWTQSPLPSHVNRTDVINYDALTKPQRIFVEQAFNAFDWEMIGRSQTYIYDYFFFRFLNLYHLQDSPSPDMEAKLDGYMRAIQAVRKL